MRTTRLICLIAAAYLCTGIGQVSAASVDTIDATSGQPNTYFVPSLGQEFVAPYFRYMGEDWGWEHNAIGGVISTASLSISAYDVDNPSSLPGTVEDEIDVIQGLSSTLGWVDIGVLSGSTDAFSYTTFDLDSSWFDEIAAGLMVQILIDQNDTNYWGVSLAKSVLSIDGAPLPNPNPNPVPVPAALWLFGTALAGLAGFGRRKHKT